MKLFRKKQGARSSTISERLLVRSRLLLRFRQIGIPEWKYQQYVRKPLTYFSINQKITHHWQMRLIRRLKRQEK